MPYGLAARPGKPRDDDEDVRRGIISAVRVPSSAAVPSLGPRPSAADVKGHMRGGSRRVEKGPSTSYRRRSPHR